MIDGAIEITPDTGAPISLTDPLSIVQSTHNLGASAVGQVDTATLNRSAAMTNVPWGESVMREGGQYQVVLASLSNSIAAESFSNALKRQGYPANYEIASNGRYRVFIPDFASLEDANHFINNAAFDLGVFDAWPAKLP